MNLVIPIAANSKFFNVEEYGYPKPLIEILGMPMVEHVIKNLTIRNSFKKIIFIVRQEHCDQFHLDQTLQLLSPIKPQIIKLRSDTEGALCSVLLAIDQINNDEPLIVSNADQIIDGGITQYLEKFMSSSLAAACLTFDSTHPRWSYVKVDSIGLVLEAAEKKPISRHAIAGLYFYKNGSEFVQNGMTSIKYGRSIEDQYYLAPVFNEYILAGKKVGHYPVPNERYHTFYTPQKINEYESGHRRS